MKSVNKLTKQEMTVLALVAKGWRNAKIASELFISTKTVETHLGRIFDKLGVSTRTQAALYMLYPDQLAKVEIQGIPDDVSHDTSYSSA